MAALHDVTEVKTLACGDSFALISAGLPGLPQTLLVQLVGSAHGLRRRSFSLYVVYREAGMTFEAIMAFDIEASTLPLDVLLTQYVQGPEFTEAVLRPMHGTVRRHFRR